MNWFQYAKDEDDPEALSIRITAYNRGPDPANLHIIPQLWFMNTWSWPVPTPTRPDVQALATKGVIAAEHQTLGKTYLHCLPSPPPVNASGEFVTITGGSGSGTPTNMDDVEGEYDDNVEPELIFTENDTNFARLYGSNNDSPYVKDAFHDYIISSHRSRPPVPADGMKMPDMSNGAGASEYGASSSVQQFVNPNKTGTKSAAHYSFKDVPGLGGCVVVRLKLTRKNATQDQAINDDELFDECINERRMEADEFYHHLQSSGAASDDLQQIMRQAFGGLMWSKQYYQFIQKEWIEGDPSQPRPPPGRKWIRNWVRI